MPELAEVETVRRQIERHFKNKKIKNLVVDAKDRWLFAFTSADDVVKALKGAKIIGTGRKGKYFWLELNRKPWPIFHLGMTGNIGILNPGLENQTHQSSWGERLKNSRDRLWFCRLLIKAESGTEMAFIDPRRFGRVWLSEDPWTHPRIEKLGHDPLLDFPTAKVIGERLQKRKKAIKAVLLDQTLFAGIGNWLADEILFQARISPHHLASKLTASQIKTLHKFILSVVEKAVAVDADHECFPKSWLFHHRWGKKKDARIVVRAFNQAKKSLKIIHEDVGGRTTAWVPQWQK